VTKEVNEVLQPEEEGGGVANRIDFVGQHERFGQ
jgi:hypothetical protein